jgi:polyisoprenoid-binding protein YceI
MESPTVKRNQKPFAFNSAASGPHPPDSGISFWKTRVFQVPENSANNNVQPKEGYFMKFANTLLASFVTWMIALPAVAADTYKIDPAHTSITFSVRHLGINNVKGRFKDFAGTVALDGKAIKEANGTIQVVSIDTEVQQRDDHLRSPDFFDAAKHPSITFKTKRVEQSGDQSLLIADFTMRGVTKEIRLPVRLDS